MLDKLPKWIFRIVSPSLAASVEPTVHLANLCCFYMLCFSSYSTEIAELVSRPYSHDRVTRYSDR